MKKLLPLCMASLFLVSLLTVSCTKKSVVAPKGGTYKTTTQTTGSSTNSDGQTSHNGCGGDHSNSSGSGS